MAKTLRILLAAATVLCVAVTALALERSFPTAPVKYIQAQGTDVILRAEDVRFCSDAKRAALVGNPAAVAAWSRCEDVLRRYGILPEFERVWSLAHGGGIASLLSMLLLGNVLMRDLPPVRIKRGPRLYSGRNGRARLKRASGKEIRRSGQGLAFPPGISLSRDRETRHFLISGGVGSGKTQTIRALILEAMKRGDKMLVLDTKGDMTRDLPGDIVLLAPQDARSAVWHVAADCRTRQDARELASRFIPKSNDPMWSEAAREVFVTCVVSLQAEKPGAWTWADLYARAILEPEALLELAQQYHPAASQLLKEPTSKTTMSILTTFKAHLHSIEALAEAWCETNDKLFPVSHWLDETMGTLPIVLQRDGRYPQLSTAWISGLIGLLSSYVGSPSFEESNERRVWLFLDEFPQLEQMEDFSALLDLGRSKGVCVVLTAQDTSQIRIRYGRDQTSSWTSMIGTHIVSRLNVGEGADDV
ncbi:MAG: type IV secretion system DNA-binding domain-containing protein, partial [Alphaproteobacteria bacterium]|nr:type IV secretion system DNA-binding domain-containing protein [Alphaproteobacteria bacterium]